MFSFPVLLAGQRHVDGGFFERGRLGLGGGHAHGSGAGGRVGVLQNDGGNGIQTTQKNRTKSTSATPLLTGQLKSYNFVSVILLRGW